MTSPHLRALLTLALSTTAAAQIGPGWSRMPSPSAIIVNGFNTIPADDVEQVHHVKLSNNPDGVWTTAVTAKNLSSFFGGAANTVGVLIGVYDPYAGTFLPTTQANALNSTADDKHLTLSPDGLWAMLDRPSGVYLASRAAVGQPFGAPVLVNGFGTLRNVYPALAPHGGQMKVFYTDKVNVLMQGIDLASATLLGSPVIVSGPAQGGTSPISPIPVIGADGDAEALWMADEVIPQTGVNTGDSDPVWANDLDPSTPALVQVQRPDYQCCGGLAGGFINFTHNISPRWHTMHGEGAWLVGDCEPIGGQADITTAGVNFSAPSPLVSTLFFAGNEGPPIPLFGFGGAFALDLATLAPFGVSFSTTRKDGIASLSFSIPNDPLLQNVSLALQAVVVDLTRLTATLTNTGWLHIK